MSKCPNCLETFPTRKKLKEHNNTHCVKVLYNTQNLNKNKTLKFIDLFCGIGGFHTAFKMCNSTNFECVFASDKDKYCRENYKDNYGVEPAADIRKVNEQDIPDHDILTGGFPCQSFSNAGKKKCMNDERGTLFHEIIRIAKHKQPKIMILENVKHIKKVDDGNVFKLIQEHIKEIGYYVGDDTIFELSPHHFGIPQQRERVIFVCIRNDIHDKNKKLNIDLENSTTNSSSIIKNTDIIDKKYNISEDIEKVLSAWEEMIKEFEVDEKISPTIMCNEFYKQYTDEEFKKLANWRQEYIRIRIINYIIYDNI